MKAFPSVVSLAFLRETRNERTLKAVKMFAYFGNPRLMTINGASASMSKSSRKRLAICLLERETTRQPHRLMSSETDKADAQKNNATIHESDLKIGRFNASLFVSRIPIRSAATALGLLKQPIRTIRTAIVSFSKSLPHQCRTLARAVYRNPERETSEADS